MGHAAGRKLPLFLQNLWGGRDSLAFAAKAGGFELILRVAIGRPQNLLLELPGDSPA
jgi:hypothetical protein